jgi:IclR family pca regulon transcriptional regulator
VDPAEGRCQSPTALLEDCVLATEISNRDYVNSLARGLEVIRAFTRTQPRMTLSEIARMTGMTRATVRRFLLTLVKEDYAETDGKYFSLRPKVLELGYAALSSMTMLDVMQPIMNRLAEKVQESCFAAVLDGADVVYIASASPPDRIVSISVSVGSRAPAHCVSTGRVLIAALPEDKRLEYLENVKLTKLTPNTVTSKVKLRSLIEETAVRGWSIVDQELEIGLRSISVPIRDRSGQVIAALNVACPSSRITPDDMHDRILLELQAASQAITAGLQR